MKHNSIAMVVVLLMLNNNSTAQSTASDTSLPEAATKRSYVELSANYISNIVFAGRKDSVAVPYLSPGIAYYHKSGLYAQGSLSMLTAANENRLDLYTLSGGYRYSNQTLAAGAQLTKYFFNERSFNVQSAMSGYGLAYFGYDISNVVMLYADAMVSFGSSSDFFTGVELSHSFYMFDDQLSITPAFYTFFGTQRYYDAYYSTRHFGMQGSGGNGNGPGGGGSGGTSETTMMLEESAAFQLLSLELSVPVSFTFNRFTVLFNPVYVFPQNHSSFNNNGVVTKELLENTFYWGVGLRYRLGKK
jgi:hypothetical protein